MPDNYLSWVNEKEANEENELEKIRLSIQRGRPYGDDKWMYIIADKLGLSSTLRSRGRPKEDKKGA
jgi:putative transposase